MTTAISIRRGATLDLPLDFFADATETTPIDLTGSTMSIVTSSFPVTPTLNMIDADSGGMQLLLSATNTTDLVANRVYHLTIKQVQPSGSVRLYGPFQFTASA